MSKMDYDDEEMALNDGPIASSSTSPAQSASAGVTGIAPADHTEVTGAGAPGTLSKKAMKRAAKRAHAEETKLERRAAERARRKQRAAVLREGYHAGTLTEEDKAIFEKRKELRTVRRNDRGSSGKDWGGGVIIDLGFDELMTDNEISSMASQLGYVYSANRISARPFATILHTSFGPTASPRMWQKMSQHGWERWTRSYWWEQGLEEVPKAMAKGDEGVTLDETPARGENGHAEHAQSGTDDLTRRLTGPNLPSLIDPQRHKVVYLSADADEELTTLSEDEVYVIGGIVDRNRHKMLCQDKAVKLGIRTARLPIGTYLENLPTRKVLTVNQVFEILAQFVIQNDWAKAFDTVIPQRKYSAGGKHADRRNQNKRQRENSDDVSEGGSTRDQDQDRQLAGRPLAGDTAQVLTAVTDVTKDETMRDEADEEEAINLIA